MASPGEPCSPHVRALSKVRSVACNHVLTRATCDVHACNRAREVAVIVRSRADNLVESIEATDNYVGSRTSFSSNRNGAFAGPVSASLSEA